LYANSVVSQITPGFCIPLRRALFLTFVSIVNAWTFVTVVVTDYFVVAMIAITLKLD
jgi:hypothetical protein